MLLLAERHRNQIASSAKGIARRIGVTNPRIEAKMTDQPGREEPIREDPNPHGPSRDEPLVTFYRFIPECRVPQRADSSAAGSIPTRAFRYCEAIRVASAFGWYLFPPIGVSFMWDGGIDISWT
jgi:hypothetical protein